ncbi:hypothetical protein BKA56DRAFT_622935 [Ilyonectria sp. MPI-CAGE-AT-0026]|nr:hypothetical protein BKA56DRAFT_622935 [Ilyonectria sp. MPI-CAGE-AT-0026]
MIWEDNFATWWESVMPPGTPMRGSGTTSSYGALIFGRDLVGDAVAAMVSSAFATPSVVLLDRALVEKSSFNQPILDVANATETIASKLKSIAISALSFVPISMVNVPLGIYKDLKLEQIYSSQTPECAKVREVVKVISRASMTAFLIRDSATMFGLFTLPTLLASAVPDLVFARRLVGEQY